MENLKIGEDPLDLPRLTKVMEKSKSYPKLLESWKKFGRNLGVNDATILALENKHSIGRTELHDLPYEILKFWRAQKGNDAKLSSLCDALLSCRLSDISETLEKEFWLDATKSLKIKFNNSIIELGEIEGINSNEKFKYIYESLKRNNYPQPIALLKENFIPRIESSYYIPRVLSITTELDEKIFKTNLNNHVFLVKGIGIHELARLSGYKPVEVSGCQLEEITVKFIVLEDDEDFDRICRITSDHVHFIRHENGCYFWVKSNKELDTIKDFFKQQKELYSETELIGKYTKDDDCPLQAVCISDSPGMGKTFLLSNLASQFKKMNRTIVIIMTLEEFIKETKIQINSEAFALKSIIEYVCPTNIAKFILEVMLKTYNINLFLDAYDEVSQDKQEMVDHFLINVVNLKQFRVFVTTRPHLRSKIENILRLRSYDILPFNEGNQVEFVVKYWTSYHSARQTISLERYAKNCVKTLRHQMTDVEMGIAGIPLQCRMLADVFAEDAKRASKLLNAESADTIRVSSLFDVYKKLIEIKFQRVPEQNRLTLMSWWFRGSMKSNYINAHVYDSILLLFPTWIEKFKPYLNGFQLTDRNIVYSIGLMEESTNVNAPRFVHRTFAEYLLAEFLVKNLRKFAECAEMVFGVILGGDGIQPTKSALDGPELCGMENVTIGYFLNMHLKDQLKQSPLKDLALDLVKYRDRIDFTNVCKSMAACGPQDFLVAFELSKELFQGLCVEIDNPLYLVPVRDTYFKHLPHLIAQSSSSLSLIKSTLDFIQQTFRVDFSFHVYNPEKTSYFPWIPGCTPLHVAVFYGKYNMVTYLLEKYGDQINEFKLLLHFCARHSSKDTESVIQHKLSIAELLIAKARENQIDLLNESLDDMTPLLETEVHFKLLRRFVELGADINSSSKDHGTILHTSVNCVNYKDLLRWAISSGFKLINSRDNNDRTPLLIAIRKEVIVDEDILDLFLKAGADFDAPDKNGDSVLFHAIKAKSVAIVCKIIDNGANVNHLNKFEQNAAHVLLEMSHIKDSREVLDKLNLLILKGFQRLNEPDVDGFTPFSQWVKNVEDFEGLELFQFFKANGV